MEKYLKNLYKEFVKFDESIFILDAQKYSSSLEGIKLPQKIIRKFYQNYSRPTFFGFLKEIKPLLFGKSIFEFVLENSSEDWALWPHLEFLKRKKIIKVER